MQRLRGVDDVLPPSATNGANLVIPEMSVTYSDLLPAPALVVKQIVSVPTTGAVVSDAEVISLIPRPH